MKMRAVDGIPVMFVLDHFECFASRKPQTLLYALLDVCQVRVFPVSLSLAWSAVSHVTRQLVKLRRLWPASVDKRKVTDGQCRLLGSEPDAPTLWHVYLTCLLG